jgi:hypothetical protein
LEESNSDTLPPVTTYFATFDSTGKKIDGIVFACQCSPDRFKVGTMDLDKNIEIKEYKNIWMNDPQKDGYLGNEVIGKELMGTCYYSLDGEGRFHLSMSDTRVGRSRRLGN